MRKDKRVLRGPIQSSYNGCNFGPWGSLAGLTKSANRMAGPAGPSFWRATVADNDRDSWTPGTDPEKVWEMEGKTRFVKKTSHSLQIV